MQNGRYARQLRPAPAPKGLGETGLHGARWVRRAKVDAWDYGAALGSVLAAWKGRVAMNTCVKAVVLALGLALVLSLGGCASGKPARGRG